MPKKPTKYWDAFVDESSPEFKITFPERIPIPEKTLPDKLVFYKRGKRLTGERKVGEDLFFVVACSDLRNWFGMDKPFVFLSSGSFLGYFTHEDGRIFYEYEKIVITDIGFAEEKEND